MFRSLIKEPLTPFGVRVRIIRLGPGHTRGDTVMFVEEDRVLFAGDLTMKGLFPAFASPQSRSNTWLASLDEMERLEPRIVVGAHYDIGDVSDIEANRGYLKALRARRAEEGRQVGRRGGQDSRRRVQSKVPRLGAAGARGGRGGRSLPGAPVAAERRCLSLAEDTRRLRRSGYRAAIPRRSSRRGRSQAERGPPRPGLTLLRAAVRDGRHAHGRA
jgi:glyoxylase-like metal-dependent hydrolase (beta-lactamase superfamily II)